MAAEASEPARPRTAARPVLAFGVAVLTYLVYLPILRNGFVWDDDFLFLDNPHYRGLGWRQLGWMLTTTFAGHYAPLTWVTHGLDYTLWGLDPFGYHLTSLLLHATNAGLVFLVARRLIEIARHPASHLPGGGPVGAPVGVPMGALVAALVFAVHPLRVEAVSWATGRRDVLAAFWTLATVVAYLGAVAGRPARPRLLTLSVAFHWLAILSKASALVTPILLLALDVYPLRRLAASPRRWADDDQRPIWREKLPYAVPSLLAIPVTAYATSHGAYVQWLGPTRWLPTVVMAIWLHVPKTLAPLGLSPLYELPRDPVPADGRLVVAASGILAVIALAWLLRRRYPGGLTALVMYLVLLAPMHAWAHAGPQLTADRYSYLATLPFAVLLGAGVGLLRDMVRRRDKRRLAAQLGLGAALVGLAGLAALTSRQAMVWHDEERLWRQAVEVSPDCLRCRLNLGVALMERGAWSAAVGHFRVAVALDPERVWGYNNNIGICLAALGRFPEAIDHYRLVLARQPGSLKTSANLATALLAVDRPRAAVEELRQVVRASDPDAAVAFFRQAVDATPAAVVPRVGLLVTYGVLGRREEAQAERQALRGLDPALLRVADAELQRAGSAGP
jgi:tetratricopeptide (TPR) repeat protein